MLYISPLKALAVDVERNLRAPLAGISPRGDGAASPSVTPEVLVAHGRHARQRARAGSSASPADILITTPESRLPDADLERARRAAHRRHGHHRRDPRAGPHQARRRTWRCRSSGWKRSWSSRCSASASRATQRPLDEVARFLGGVAGQNALRPSRQSARGQAKQGVQARQEGAPRASKCSPRQRRSESPADCGARDPRRVRGPSSVVRSPVTVVDAGARKTARAADRSACRRHGAASGKPVDIPSGPASQVAVRRRSGPRSIRACSI